MNNIHWSHGWGLVGQIISLAAVIYSLGFAYVWLASQLGAYLHRRDVEQQFRALLKREQNAVDAARKAKIDSWVKAEEEKYLAETEAKFLSNYADVITREDAEAFSNDYADQQPHRPQGPRAA